LAQADGATQFRELRIRSQYDGIPGFVESEVLDPIDTLD